MQEASKKVLDVAEVERIAALAHLALGAEEKASMAAELGKILSFVERLSELDVSDVSPTTQVDFEGARSFRGDEPGEELSRERALAEAPKVSDGGFSVPAFVDEG